MKESIVMAFLVFCAQEYYRELMHVNIIQRKMILTDGRLYTHIQCFAVVQEDILKMYL